MNTIELLLTIGGCAFLLTMFIRIVTKIIIRTFYEEKKHHEQRRIEKQDKGSSQE